MKQVIMSFIFVFCWTTIYSQIKIPDSEREMEEVGSTGYGVILNKVPGKNYYNFTTESNILSSNICRLSFGATPAEMDDLYYFFLSKLGTDSTSNIEIGNEKIKVISNEYGLYFGRKDVCSFHIQSESDLKRLFNKD